MNNEELTLEQLDELILVEKKRQLDLMLAQEKLMKNNKLQFFIPSPKQLEFIKNAHKKRRAVFAGNRFGKSTIGVVEDCCFAIGYRPFYPEGHPLRYHGIPDRGIKGLVIAEDWDKVKEIFTNNEPNADRLGKFFEWLPADSIVKVEKNSLGTIYVIHIQSTVHGRIRKSSIYFDTVRSFKSNGAAHESSDWDFIHCDEPIPNDMWIAASRGLIDRKGHAWALLTPLREAWLYDYMLEGAAMNPDVFYVLHADMMDNPTLDKVETELFLSQLSPEERECRQKGIPLQSGRLVYHHFNEAAHLIKGTPAGWENCYTPPDDWDVAFAIDPHPQTPHAVLLVAISPHAVIFFADLFIKSTFKNITDDKNNIIKEGLATRIRRYISGYNVLYQICDPCAWIKDPQSGRCWADDLREAGLDLDKASKSKTTGIQEANEWLAGTKGKKMYITESCQNFLREVKKYHYTDENKPIDKDDHIMECFYRLVVKDGFRYYGRDTSTIAGESYKDDTNPDLNEYSNAQP